MTHRFQPPYRSVRLVAGAVLGLGLVAMPTACAPQVGQPSNEALAQMSQGQAEKAERVRAVQNASDALGQRLDRLVSNASLSAQR